MPKGMLLSHIEVTIFFSVKCVCLFFFIEELELNIFVSKFKGFLHLSQPEETADILLHHRWFRYEVTPEEAAQKFHTDDMSLAIEANFQSIRSTTEIRILACHQYRISALVSQSHFEGNQQLCREMSDDFPGDTLVCIYLN